MMGTYEQHGGVHQMNAFAVSDCEMGMSMIVRLKNLTESDKSDDLFKACREKENKKCLIICKLSKLEISNTSYAFVC